MKQLFTAHQDIEFGANYLFPTESAPTYQITGKRRSVLRRQIRELCSQKPGVYAMFNKNGELTYVGKAKNLRLRLLSYFRPKSRNPKAGRIITNTVRIAWEISPDEFAALHRELELIRRWRPCFNVHGQPDGRRPIYVCLGKQPAPYVYLARKPSSKAIAWFGPLPSALHLRESIRRLNDYYGLRDCPQAQTMYFTDDKELFEQERAPGCLRYEIGTCLGPCAKGCSQKEYSKNVQDALEFLQGNDPSALVEIEKEMHFAAQDELYELAATLRDRLVVLRWLHEQLEQLRELRSRGAFVYRLRGWDGVQRWYLIQAGQTVAALPAPIDDDAKKKAQKIIEAVYHKSPSEKRDDLLTQRDSMLLVASWFRRYPKQRKHTMQPEEVLLTR